MHIIKLNAIDSTNSYLKTLVATKLPKDYTVVIANHQTNGRGQMGTTWQSESSKNLIFSIFKQFKNIAIEDQFYISMAVALAIQSTLKQFSIPKLRIKWPNDILSEHKKICGILIENMLKLSRIEGSVIGIGLNVNQNFFEHLPQASSMYLKMGQLFDLDEVFSQLFEFLKFYLEKLSDNDYKNLKIEYESVLFRMGKASTFETPNGKIFTGIIKGVSEKGRLKILMEDDVLETFNFKEIILKY